ncbi:PPA1309 family protein [Gordonia shandongensis]|uniref:PPA1309 family protein n=1 Tax=Gordonia shandongensis TaxID=376351 RepID=UPI000400AB69|nr:PPA1309 family protein [Gordonia shandongensis]
MTTPDDASASRFSQADLGNALAQCLAYTADIPWGSGPVLFALVPTALLARQVPDLVDPDDGSALSPVVQETTTADLESLLSTVAWPDQVVGCAVVTEITVLPPDAESDLDAALEPLLADPSAADEAGRRAALAHPDRQAARLAGGVLRTGSRVALLSLRDGDRQSADLQTHPELAPNLLDALAATMGA